MSILLLRFIKFIAMFILLSGTVGAFTSSSLADRQRAAYWLATPGFILTWVSGYMLAEARHISLGSPWISATILLSLLSLAVTVWSVEKVRSTRWLTATIALGALVASSAVMVWQVGGTKIKTVEIEEVSP